MSRPRKDSIDNLPPINKRLLELIDVQFGGNREAFCEHTHMSVRSLPNYFGSKPNVPATKIVQQWKEYLPELDLNWFLNGIGSMLVKNTYAIDQDNSEKKMIFRDIENSAIGSGNNVSRDSATLNMLVNSLKEQLNIYKEQMEFGKITVSSLQNQVKLLERENEDLRNRLGGDS